MKKIFYASLVLAIVCLTAFTYKTTNEKIGLKSRVKVKTYKLLPKQSKLEWSGTWFGGKNNGKTHSGTVQITSGTVNEAGKIYTGNFVVDMNSITSTDMKDPKKNAKLAEDLKSNYFFNVAKFPDVKVKLNGIMKDEVSLTISVLGVSITQKAPIKVTTKDNKMNASGTFYFNLAKAGVKELFANPEKAYPKQGGLSSNIKFTIDANLVSAKS